MTQARRTYDHRIRESILDTGDRNLFPELHIPQSTMRSRVHRGLPDVVTSELVTCDRAELISEIHALRQRTALLAAVVGPARCNAAHLERAPRAMSDIPTVHPRRCYPGLSNEQARCCRSVRRFESRAFPLRDTTAGVISRADAAAQRLG